MKKKKTFINNIDIIILHVIRWVKKNCITILPSKIQLIDGGWKRLDGSSTKTIDYQYIEIELNNGA